MKHFAKAAMGRMLAVLAWTASCPVVAATTDHPNGEPAVQLPPMIVSDMKNARPWHYVAIPGLAVLSRCDDAITTDFVQRYLRLAELVRVILPDALQLQTTLPKLQVLVPADAAPAMSRDLIAATKPTATQRKAEDPKVEMIPNLVISDYDEQVVFAIVDPHTFNSDAMVFTSDHLRVALERRTPPLPAWFVAGEMALFAHAYFDVDTIRIQPLTWLGAENTLQLQNDPDAPRMLLPMADFFAATPRSDDETAAPELWRAEAELFMRWALDAPERREALWKFVAATSAGESSEAALRAAFGVDFVALRDRLSDFLPSAVRKPTVIAPAHLAAFPHLDFHPATTAQVAAVKGEWERLAYGYVRRRHPEYAPQYLALARETLSRGREAEPLAPAILEVAGLLALDSDEQSAARSLFEAAANGHHARPRVYAELAALRLAEMATANQGHVSAAQTEIITQTLSLADVQQPPMPITAAVRAELWMRSDVPMPPAELERLRMSLGLFPKFAPLLYYAAVIEARENSIPAALALIDRGLALDASPTIRKLFLELRSHLTTGASGR